MGNACSNHLGIPPAKGPNAVGCTDFMMDHTAQVPAEPHYYRGYVHTVYVLYLWTDRGADLRELLVHREASSGFIIPAKRLRRQKNQTGSHARSILTVWQTS